MPGSLGVSTRRELQDTLFGKRVFKSMIAKKDAWLVFDLDNGDEDKGYYVWWFPTRKMAREHIAWQKQKKDNAELSAPIKFVRKK